MTGSHSMLAPPNAAVSHPFVFIRGLKSSTLHSALKTPHLSQFILTAFHVASNGWR
jgi:hypothetical protein